MSESYVEYEVTGSTGEGYPPYRWCPITKGDKWTDETILNMVRHLVRRDRVADLNVRRRTVTIGEWEAVNL